MAVSVAQVLRMDVLRQGRILAGAQHLDRPVEHINILEVFIEGDELLDFRNHLFLTTFAFTGNDVARQAAMVELMAGAGCAAVLFQEGVVAPLADAVIAAAERHGMPLIEVPGTVYYHQIIERLAFALLHDQAGRRQREDLLEALLSTADPAALQALAPRLAKAGWTLGDQARVVRLSLLRVEGDAAADDAQVDAHDHAIRMVVDAIALADPRAPVALFRGDAAWLPTEVDDSAAGDARLRAQVTHLLERVHAAGPHWRWRVGVGDATRANEAPGLVQSLAQADKAMAMAASLPELGAVVAWQQVAMPALLLELSERADVRRWQARTLGALQQVAAERADLIRTLDVFLDTGNSHKQTARVLGIHPKTLKYRVERIEAILGAGAWDAEQRLSLHLAVKLARLHRPAD